MSYVEEFGGGSSAGIDTEARARITVLEDIVYEIEIFELIGSGTTGTITKPTDSTIILDQYESAGDCLIVQVDSNNKPINKVAITAGGVAITSTLDVAGAYAFSGTPSPYPVALIYQIQIKGVNLGNVPLDNIIDQSEIITHDNLDGVKLAGAGETYGHIDDQIQTIAGAKTFSANIAALNLSGTNTGDQTSIADFTGTKAEFDTALTNGDFAYLNQANVFTEAQTIAGTTGELLSVGADADISARIGKIKMGGGVSGMILDRGYISHYDKFGADTFAMRIDLLDTILNSNGAGSVYIRNDNEGVAQFSGTAISLKKPTTITGALTVSEDSLINSLTVGRGGGNISTNTANGYLALSSNTTGNRNTANGYQALYSNTTGSNNTANGVNALYSNTTGNSNTAYGVNALLYNTTGYNNTANGYRALYSNTEGSNNTAYGVNALLYNETGANNTAYGVQALYSNTTGIQNTANGVNALFANTTGSNNIAIGYNSQAPSATSNNTATFGNDDTAETYLKGNVNMPSATFSSTLISLLKPTTITGSLGLTEITTPTAVANQGKVYTKTDNKLYFQDGAGVEHEIAFV